jgi:hypothetical protein
VKTLLKGSIQTPPAAEQKPKSKTPKPEAPKKSPVETKEPNGESARQAPSSETVAVAKKA